MAAITATLAKSARANLLFMSPSPRSALSAKCIRGTRPKRKPPQGRSGFHARQLNSRKVALRYARCRRTMAVAGVFLFAGTVDGRARRRERGGNTAVARDAANAGRCANRARKRTPTVSLRSARIRNDRSAHNEHGMIFLRGATRTPTPGLRAGAALPFLPVRERGGFAPNQPRPNQSCTG